MKRIVLTGGPCAGKSTTLEVLRKEFDGQLLIVPEVATMLLNGGFPRPGRDLKWSPEWQAAFQAAVLAAQIQFEAAYELAAAEKGINLLVCDRGQLDGAAYTPGGLAEFCRRYGIIAQPAYEHYNAILHLESVATGDPACYSQTNNSARFESLEQAREVELATRRAWRAHPKWTFLSCGRGIEGKINGVRLAVGRELSQ